MQQEQNFEQRLIIAEAKIAELERKTREQSGVELALLTRIDAFIDDLHRVEREQLRAFQSLKADSLDTRSAQTQRDQAMLEALQDHKQHIEALAAGQQQIISLLTGNTPPRND